jgi:hypothetical protein
MKTAVLDGKPIQIRPPRELRKRLESEAREQNRSLNNLIIVLLGKFFRMQDEAANAQRQEG